MKSFIPFTFVLILLLVTLSATGQEIHWSATYGGPDWDWATAIDQTSDGGFILTILTYSFSSSSDILLVRTNADGDTLWTKLFNETSAVFGASVQQTSDSGFIIFGNAGGGNLNDGLVIKTDANGDTMWTYRYEYFGEDYGRYVMQTKDSGYVFAGRSQVHPPNYIFGDPVYYDAWLMRMNQNGDTLWNRKYGWAGDDEANWIAQTHDGGFIVAGSCKPGVPLLTDKDFWLLKIDATGDSVWSSTFGGTGNEIGYSVVETEDGYVIVGYTNSYGSGNNDCWLIKADTAGHEIWNKTIGGSNDELIYDIQATNDGGFLLSGRTGIPNSSAFDVWIVKTNSAGDTVWTKTLGDAGFDGASKAVITSDNGYAIAAQTEFYNTHGSSDAWLIRFKGDPTDVRDRFSTPLPSSYQLCNNYPNPFNPSTDIRYQIPEAGFVELKIVNILGQEITTLVNEIQQPGSHIVTWDASAQPGGVYLYRLQYGRDVQTNKMMLIK